ncbi:twin-arginine translocase subunit TatC [Marinobacter persicus]|jgi:sec-independent protein translocase protein TatC|uniref:Sec-independent protein translocase protein TatC n=1 Tax=Marinobacter persicus TaxID=930118 RepID=A0A2S6GAS9_9GAMM|nr:twin-arginine translocase subunit TatC [Marinobacter persicus]PPK53637.1 sec-independent protein translocase protein TatC [Marinobacter persicus]PPK56451.1 sec-independent protein translocase protein TatC [Marinobacter persicus]PPK60024.1 sec-independent protein translocase protein TatC [Marinobacter persicus]
MSATPDGHQTPPEQGDMPLIEHLLELRSRLLKMVLAVAVCFVVLYPFANELYLLISEPLRELLPVGQTMIATDITSPFFAPLKLSLVLALFIAIPVVLYQLWSFIAPGLYAHEKRLAFPLLFTSVLLFYAGAAFAYFVVFPLVFGFFTAIGPEGIVELPDINSYLNFVLKMFFAFGVAFEIPIATVLLVLTGATTPENLAAKRPYVIVGCFVIGMLLTPPDIISQTLLAVPMWILFEFGILASRFARRDLEQASESEQTGE